MKRNLWDPSRFASTYGSPPPLAPRFPLTSSPSVSLLSGSRAWFYSLWKERQHTRQSLRCLAVVGHVEAFLTFSVPTGTGPAWAVRSLLTLRARCLMVAPAHIRISKGPKTVSSPTAGGGLHFVCVPLCFVKSSEGQKEASPPLEILMASRKDGFPHFRCVRVGRKSSAVLGWSLSVFFQSQTFWHAEVSLSIRCHVAFVLNYRNINKAEVPPTMELDCGSRAWRCGHVHLLALGKRGAALGNV